MMMTETRRAAAPRKRQKRAEETRAALLQTATTAFSTGGFDGVSVRQLEEAAGVKRGLVGYHFSDKEQLWRAVVQRLFSALTEDFANRLETLNDVAPIEAARALVKAFVRYSAAHPELNRLMLQECTGDSWRVTCIVEEYVRPMLEGLRSALPEAAALIWGRGDAHRYYLMVGAGAFVFSAQQECRHLFGIDPRDDAFVERHAELVADLLVGS